jgi:hypothetical protein
MKIGSLRLVFVFLPSFEEGRPRRSNKMQRYLRLGAAGEVKHMSKVRQMFDLPRRAEAKVAWHLLDRRAAPSSKEGILTALNITRSTLNITHSTKGTL